MRIDWKNYDKDKARAIAKKFGTAVVTEMMHNITQMSLVDKATLLRSVKSSVRSESGFAGEVSKISFTYQFLENGANNVFGKGVNIKAKHWRNNAIEKHKEDLDSEFSQFYAELVLGELHIDNAKMEM
jgi:hypothetical protein